MRFSKVLFIGPDYKDHRGGIGAILETYALNIPDFKFVPSFKPLGVFGKIKVFLASLFHITSKLIKDKEIKIVHIHGSHGASVCRKVMIIYLSNFLFNKKVIYHLNASSFDKIYSKGNPFYKLLCRLAVKRSDFIIAVSPSWYNYYSTTFKPKGICIINNIVALPVTKSVGSRSGKLRFLFLGRIGDRKGIFDLLTVINKNKAQWQDKLELQVGGDGEIERLNEFISSNDLSNMVTYLGWVDTELKQAALSGADFLVLPSYNEGLPIAILEAMSYGLPVLASNVGGIPEVVKNGLNGITFNPGNLDEIESGINTLLNKDEKQIKEMGTESLKIVNDYLPDKVLDELEKLYNSLI